MEPTTDADGYAYQQRQRSDIRGELLSRQRACVAAGAAQQDNASVVAPGGAELPSLPSIVGDAVDSSNQLLRPLFIQAPMVRCSRAAFRQTCRLWGTDVSYTHMFMAESIARSRDARAAEISFYEGETNIVAQIAAKDAAVAGEAASVLAPFVDAIDFNCGCPQRWAISEGVGAALMQSPELVADMVSTVRRVADIPCVVKTRVFDDPRRSVDWARQQEAAGAGWITIHGRLPKDPPSCPVRWETVKIIRESVQCPVVINGGVESVADAMQLALRCGVGGAMSARALLNNPAMFGGFDKLPTACLEDFLRLAIEYDTRATVVQHHVGLMMEATLSPQERNYLSQQRSIAGVVTALRQCGVITWGA